MLATVRNRRGIVTSVEASGEAAEGRVHLVTVEYLDPDGAPADTLIWEREVRARLLEPTALPDPAAARPMPASDFDALVRAARWSALTPFLDPDGREGPLDRLPFASPLHGAIQTDDFQLVPLLVAMRMPRVSLLLADDVGLGKTVEAGLVLTELILRRRIRHVLILCPASLRTQWKQEMHDKFSLDFDVVDRPATHRLQRRLGLDANPWRTFPRVITSYDYLKQPDVLEQFRAARRPAEGSPHLPWDLLIVDEAHNLAPASFFGNDSEAARMLRELAPRFDHRLFLTATPHNGHTCSFTGLLECLDPVRFTRKADPMTDAEKERARSIVVRRLKREINARTDPPRFPERTPRARELRLSAGERQLSAAFSAFRSRVHQVIGRGSRPERLAGSFAVEILGKRLLSSPVTFADSWRRYLRGTEEDEAATADEVRAAERSLGEATGDDNETEGRARHAARTVGAWLKPLKEQLAAEIAGLEQALARLRLGDPEREPVETDPVEDARFDALQQLVEERLRRGGRFRDDERLVVFTEYKTTLDYLERRLRRLYPADGAIRVLYGGMDDADRDPIKEAFNDPADPVRILLATDAAAEGLNLQATARLLLHFDIPWNPARLEQRNGRLDRHGQARDVEAFHFATDDDRDLSFLAYVVGKVHTIREDLGATGEVFDRALERRLVQGADDAAVRDELDRGLEHARGRADLPRAAQPATGEEEREKLAALVAAIDLDADSLRDTLDVALGLGAGRPRLEGPDGQGRFRLRSPVPAPWQALVEDALQSRDRAGVLGPLPGLVFDARRLIADLGGRPVFRPRRDTVLLHLGHPLFRGALTALARERFPGARPDGGATRWTVRREALSAGCDALVLLTVEELATNEMRETFHHWVRTLRLPVRDGRLGDPLPHLPARDLRVEGGEVPPPADVERARSLWDEIAPEVETLVGVLAGGLTDRLRDALEAGREQAREQEESRIQQRQGEVSRMIEETSLGKIEREIEALRRRRDQGVLFDPGGRLEDLERSIEQREEEVRRRRQHYEELRAQLQVERERVLKQILPRRYALRGAARVFPVAVEIRLPEREGGGG